MHVTAPLSRESSIQSLRPLVEAALARSRALLPAEVGLSSALSDAPLGVRGNARQLEQVLVSLCTVAWLALGAESGRVVVTMDEVILDEVVLDDEAAQLLGGLPPRRYARLCVSNSAQGFDDAVPVANCEPRLPSAPHSEEARLGMTVVREIISAHHGTFTFQHTVDQGTTYEIYLPVVAAPVAIPTSADEFVDTRPGQPAHVLYVDDYEPMRLLVSEMLQDAGCEVSCYRRPQDALAAVQADPQGFDLVATDQYMPEMSGINFALALKNIRPGLPVAIISGYVDEDLKRRALEAGARLVLKKSDSLDMLCEELLQLLEAA